MTKNPIPVCCRTCRDQATLSAEEPCLSCPTRLEMFESKWRPKVAPKPTKKLSDQMLAGSVWEIVGRGYNPYTILKRLATCATVTDKEGDISSMLIYDEVDRDPARYTLISPAPAPEPPTLADVLPEGTCIFIRAEIRTLSA